MSAGSSEGELRLRVLSAVALGAVALAALWTGPLPFACLVVVIGFIMCWEWGHVVRGADYDLPFWIHAGAVIGAVVFTSFGIFSLAFITLVAGTLAIAWLRSGQRAIVSLVGVGYVGLPAMALIWLRQDPDGGFLAVLFVFVMVWTHDTFAMLIGRAVGGPKLWPRLSPNKTCSGLVGGLAACVVAGAVYGALLPAGNWVMLSGVGLVLGIAAFAGDLAESALKRRHSLKNASNLIPGHGGFMDRLDGAVIAALVAGLIALVVNIDAPASALIYLR